MPHVTTLKYEPPPIVRKGVMRSLKVSLTSLVSTALVAVIVLSIFTLPSGLSQTATTTTRQAPPPGGSERPPGPNQPSLGSPSVSPSSVAVKVGDCSITVMVERQVAARAEGATTAPGAPSPSSTVKEVETIKKIIVCVVSADPLRLTETVIIETITCVKTLDFTSIDCSGPTRILPK